MGSKIWQYFDKNELNNNDNHNIKIVECQCKLCPYKTKLKGHSITTSNLWQHVRMKHSTFLESSTNITSNKKEKDDETQSNTSNTSIQPQITEAWTTIEVNEKLITEKIIQMICKDTLPISFVENKGFHNFLNYLIPSYNIPCQKTIGLRINAMYEHGKQKLIAELSKVNFLSITTDCWISSTNESYITLTCHWISDDWQFISKNLTTQRYSVENLENELKDILINWEIYNKCVAIVHENGENIVKTENVMPCDSVCCVAHTFQLVINKMFNNETIKELIAKCSGLVDYFENSTAFKNNETELNVKENKLVQHVKNNWTSTFYMLQKLLDQREELFAILSDRIITTQLSEDEWFLIETIILLLEPFEKATNILSSEKKPSLSIVMPILGSILKNFILKTSDQDTQIIKKIKKNFEMEFKQKFNNICNFFISEINQTVNLYDISTFLDPRFKNTERYNGSIINTKRYLQNLISENDEDTNLGIAENGEPYPKRTAFDFFFPDNNVAPTNEIDMYDTELIISKNLCPLDWWKINNRKYPKLSKIATKMLCIPAVSEALELFSNAGNILRAKRCCLEAKYVKQICFLNKNL